MFSNSHLLEVRVSTPTQNLVLCRSGWDEAERAPAKRGQEGMGG